MSLFGVSRTELALYGFVFGSLALAVGIPLVLSLRYYRLGTGLRLLGRRTGVDRRVAVPAVAVALAVVAASGDRDAVRSAVRIRVRYAGALGVALLALGGVGMALALP